MNRLKTPRSLLWFTLSELFYESLKERRILFFPSVFVLALPLVRHNHKGHFSLHSCDA